MTNSALCPQCGAALPEGLLLGLCPRCVARQAVGILAARTAAAPAAPSTLNPQLSTSIRYFGDYELLEEIARGGMGVVWKARQVSLNRIVAVKLLLSGKFSSPEFVQRFRAEAEAAANLQHPNIVAIHEVGEHEGQQYFSMDYVDGPNLAQLARDQPQAPKRAAAIVKTVAEAVHYAHQRGVIHRDLKPSNVLLDASGLPHVTDFGLAKRLPNPELETEDLELTQTGQVLGTPGYMSPEQAGGRRGAVTATSDIYSLGAVLYFLVTGRAPFAAGSLEETLRQVHELEPVSPRLLNPTVPHDLETICLKCLEKEPRKRYTTAQELAEELGRFLNDETICARPASRPEKLWRWCRRKPALALAVGALLLVGGAGLAGILWQWQRAEQNAEAASKQSARAEQHAARETTQRLRAEEAATSLELQRAEDLLEKDDVVLGVAYLARIVRQQPTNRIATQRLLSSLTQRNFALPVGLPLQHGKKVRYAEFSPDGALVVTASLDLTARIWNARTGEPLTAPMLHLNAVRRARFSPDGLRLVTYDDNFRAHLWDAATGRVLGEPMPHARSISSVQFSPDGRRVLTASEDGTARVWDAQTGESVMPPLTHEGKMHSASFSPDGRLIATASSDKTVQLWDADTGRPVLKPLTHSAKVEGVEFSPDGKRVVTAAMDFSTCVWDVTSGERLTKPLVHAGGIAKASFSPDGERIIVALRTGLTRIFNARDWAPLTVRMQHRDWTTSVEFGPEAQRVLTGSFDNTARLWDAGSGEPLSAPMQHDGLIWSARFSLDGLFAVTASADGTARVWDIRLGAARSAPMNHGGRVLAAEFSSDGEWVVTASQDNTARIWNARTGQQRGLALMHSGVMAAKFSPDGERVATASSDRTARIWDVRTGHPLTEPLRHGAPLDFVDLSSDGNWLVTASKVTNIVRLWNARTGAPHGEPIALVHHASVVCFSPDSQHLLSSDNKDDQVQLRDVVSGRLLAETPAREGNVAHGEFSPDGQRVVTASEDGTARIWNAQTLQHLTKPMRHKGSVTCARFSRDGRWVVTASDDGTAQVWDAHTSQPVGEPMRHRGSVKAAEFSPDGALVVTASDDGTARLWDARTGRRVAEPFEHGGNVVAAHFSPDGRRVLTASKSGSAHLWDVPPTVPLLDPRSSRRKEAHSLPENDQSLLTSAATVRADESPGVLLADLAEAVIGKRVNAQGALENVSSAGFGEVRQRVSALPRDADFTRWLEWFFADRSTRTISPYSTVSLPQYIQARAEETDVVSWREALMLCPTNGIAFAQMTGHHLRQNPAPAPTDVACADWASRQAVQFATERSPPWQRRIEVMEHTGGWTQLMAEADQVIQSRPANAYAWISKSRCLTELGQFEAVAQPYNAVFWNAKGLLHEKAGQIQQAEASFAKALEVASLPAVSWDFESGRTSPNWKPIHQLANIVVERGILSFDNTGGDPYLELYLPPVDGTTHRWFHVRMKNATSGKGAAVYWRTEGDPKFDEARVVEFPIIPNDRQFTVYTVDMGHQAWTKNRIVRLRFDPVGERGHIDIDWICLHTNSKPPADVSGWVEIADPEMRRLALSNLERLRRQ